MKLYDVVHIDFEAFIFIKKKSLYGLLLLNLLKICFIELIISYEDNKVMTIRNNCFFFKKKNEYIVVILVLYTNKFLINHLMKCANYFPNTL